MKRLIQIVVIVFFLHGCDGVDSGNARVDVEKTKIRPDSIAETQPLSIPSTRDDNLVLSEHQFGHIPLPFPHLEVMASLKENFGGYRVSKEMGQQDGPDFPLYSVKNAHVEMAYFEMDWQDPKKMSAVYVKDPLIKDEYGLAVGDSYAKVKQLRGDLIQVQTDVHMHTYATIDGSNILYEIVSAGEITNTSDSGNRSLTEEQLRHWYIQRIIWRAKL